MTKYKPDIVALAEANMKSKVANTLEKETQDLPDDPRNLPLLEEYGYRSWFAAPAFITGNPKFTTNFAITWKDTLSFKFRFPNKYQGFVELSAQNCASQFAVQIVHTNAKEGQTVKCLKALFAVIKNTMSPVLVVGDFNYEPQEILNISDIHFSQDYKRFIQTEPALNPQSLATSDLDTYFKSDKMRGITMKRRIDYAFQAGNSRGKLKIKYLDYRKGAGIHLSEYVSDHRPIFVEWIFNSGSNGD